MRHLFVHKKEELPLLLGQRKTWCRSFVQVARGCFLSNSLLKSHHTTSMCFQNCISGIFFVEITKIFPLSRWYGCTKCLPEWLDDIAMTLETFFSMVFCCPANSVPPFRFIISVREWTRENINKCKVDIVYCSCIKTSPIEEESEV